MGTKFKESLEREFADYEVELGRKLSDEEKEDLAEFMLPSEPWSLAQIRELALYTVEKERRKKQQKS